MRVREAAQEIVGSTVPKISSPALIYPCFLMLAMRIARIILIIMTSMYLWINLWGINTCPWSVLGATSRLEEVTLHFVLATSLSHTQRVLGVALIIYTNV